MDTQKDYYGYTIYSNGDILSLKGKKMKHSTHKDGTKRITLRINDKRKKFGIARLIYCVFNDIDIDTLDKDQCVTFKDKNRKNVYLNNLICVHRNELNKYKQDNKTRVFNNKAEKIKELYDGTNKSISYKKISKEFNIKYFNIYKVLNTFNQDMWSNKL